MLGTEQIEDGMTAGLTLALIRNVAQNTIERGEESRGERPTWIGFCFQTLSIPDDDYLASLRKYLEHFLDLQEISKKSLSSTIVPFPWQFHTTTPDMPTCVRFLFKISSLHSTRFSLYHHYIPSPTYILIIFLATY